MDIEKFCEKLTSKNIFEQIMLNNRLETEMNKICKTDKGWKYFCFLLENGNTNNTKSIPNNSRYDPSNILALCLKLGLKTDTDLYNFVEYMNTIDVDGLIECHSPSLKELLKIDPDNPIKEMTYISVKNIIKNLFPVEDSLIYSEQLDSIYLSPNKKQVEYCLQQNITGQLKYIANRRDCDDYAFMFRSFLSINGYGNLTIPYVSINVYNDDGNIKFAHGINIIIYNDGTCKFMDPQSDKLWNPSEKMPWGMKKYNIKIRYILF
jgi:hypothetical protein